MSQFRFLAFFFGPSSFHQFTERSRFALIDREKYGLVASNCTCRDAARQQNQKS